VNSKPGSFGKKKEVVGYFMPGTKPSKLVRRKLGIMQGKATATFQKEWKMTEEDLLGS